MNIKHILFAFSLTLLFSSPSYAGFWDFLKKDKGAAPVQSEEAASTGDAGSKPAEPAVAPKPSAEPKADAQPAPVVNEPVKTVAPAPASAPKADVSAAPAPVVAPAPKPVAPAAVEATAASSAPAPVQKTVPVVQDAAEIAKKAEAEKAVAAAQAVELAKKAEAEKAAKLAELAKKAEAEKAKAAELAKKAEAEKAAKLAELAKKAEVEKAKAAELAKKAEEEKAAKAAKAQASIVAAPVVQAAVTTSGKMTAMGADQSGNADGSIPAWTGSMNGLPAGLTYSRSGDAYPDPYGAEQPKFTIHAGNMTQYAAKMSEGLQALMKKYPDTFVLNVYPSHRDAKMNELLIQRTAWNSSRTKLVNGVDGLENYTGGIPFPAPKSGAEVMWNGRLTHIHPTLNGIMDDMAVYLNGNTQLRRQQYTAEFPFAYKENALGMVDDKIGINAAFIMVTVDKPDRQKGQMTIIHEALDQVNGERKAWVYIPGSRRVRRAPTVGFDTPDGPGGLVTVDDSLGFNGAMVRYDWKLVGKKEMYIPYHAYKFDDAKIDYSTLLQEGHANPDYMRYELHRVWIVEANLKSGQRHVYAKRRFYLDEDSWQIVLTESYDGRGNLWRVGILNTLYDYILKAYITRAHVFHDLQSGAYIAQRLTNETGQMNLLDTPKGENFFTPSNLRTMGK